MAAHPSDHFTVEPLGPDTWDAFAALVERHNGIFGGCWCTYFHPECADRLPGYEGSRRMKQDLVEAGRAHAALVILDEEAIAWAEFGTPEELPNIHHGKQYLAEADLLPDYRVTCVEGYPHQVGEKRMSNSFVYNGTRGMYEDAGFEFIRAKGLRNTVMRRRVDPT